MGIGFRLGWLSEAYLQAGRLDDAIAVVQRALDRAQKSMERAPEAWALRLLGEISSQAAVPEVDKAEEHYRRALTLAVELGMRPLMAHCHVGLGKLYRRIGNGQQAEEHLATATAMMREMEMGLWLEQAEAELKELG